MNTCSSQCVNIRRNVGKPVDPPVTLVTAQHSLILTGTDVSLPFKIPLIIAIISQ